MESIAVLRETVQRAVEKRPELRSRIEKAVIIALFRSIQQRPDGGWWVGSENDPEAVYAVSADYSSCECQDHRRRPELRCKHILAVRLKESVERQEAEREEALRIDLALAYAGA